MKHIFLPIVILLTLLAVSLQNAHYVSAQVETWCTILEQAETSAEQEDWAAAATSIDRVFTLWTIQQTYFHIVIEHEEIDAAESLFRKAIFFAQENDDAEFLACIAELRVQLQLLQELQLFSVRNIL